MKFSTNRLRSWRKKIQKQKTSETISTSMFWLFRFKLSLMPMRLGRGKLQQAMPKELMPGSKHDENHLFAFLSGIIL